MAASWKASFGSSKDLNTASEGLLSFSHSQLQTLRWHIFPVCVVICLSFLFAVAHALISLALALGCVLAICYEVCVNMCIQCFQRGCLVSGLVKHRI